MVFNVGVGWLLLNKPTLSGIIDNELKVQLNIVALFSIIFCNIIID